jgi:hypothetical protein
MRYKAILCGFAKEKRNIRVISLNLMGLVAFDPQASVVVMGVKRGRLTMVLGAAFLMHSEQLSNNSSLAS